MIAEPVRDRAFPGEDRSWGGRILYVDLIPPSCWFTSARSALPLDDWASLARRVRKRAREGCEICSDRRTTLDVHERWTYHEADNRRVQRLGRLIGICRRCHQATHMGAGVRGRDANIRAHIASVNGWSPERVDDHIRAAYAKLQERSAYDWHLDLTLLEKAGYRPRRPLQIGPASQSAIEQLPFVQRSHVRHSEVSGEIARDPLETDLRWIGEALTNSEIHGIDILAALSDPPPHPYSARVWYDNMPAATIAFGDDAFTDAQALVTRIPASATRVAVIASLPYLPVDPTIIVTYAISFVRAANPPNISMPVALGPILVRFTRNAKLVTLPVSEHAARERIMLLTALVTRALLEDPEDIMNGFARVERALDLVETEQHHSARYRTHEHSAIGQRARIRDLIALFRQAVDSGFPLSEPRADRANGNSPITVPTHTNNTTERRPARPEHDHSRCTISTVPIDLPAILTWREHLMNVLTTLRDQSLMPTPPPAGQTALRYIHEVGLRLGLHLPPAYVELLTVVNGLSSPALTLYGANIVTSDPHARIDIVNGHTAFGEHHHHGDTIYGHTADALFAYLHRQRRYAIVDRQSLQPRLTYDTFESFLECILASPTINDSNHMASS